MSLDYANLLYTPVYDTFGIPATINTAGGQLLNVTVINLTVASSISNTIGVDFQAFRPSASVRMSELPGLVLQDELPGGEIEMAGKSWSIKSYEYIASPNGINDGELRLILKDDLDV